MSSRLPVLLLFASLSACGSGRQADSVDVAKPGERGIALSNLSAMPVDAAPDGARVSATVIRTRVLSGTWTSRTPARLVQMSFGNDGSVSVEDYVPRGRKDALVGAATGRYSWRPDGMVTGSLAGTTGSLKPFASFRISFASSDVATVHGDGASLDISQRSARGSR